MRPVAVLAGGKGTRLGYDGQKCLAPVAGRPFLDWKLDRLLMVGATELHLLVSYRADDVRDLVGDDWFGVPVTYHYDNGANRVHAHHCADLPFFHWLTYGDCLLDVPLVYRPWPYRYTNTEFADAGVMFCWGRSSRFAPRKTEARSYHLNTRADLAECEAYLRGAHEDLHRLGRTG